MVVLATEMAADQSRAQGPTDRQKDAMAMPQRAKMPKDG